MQIDDQRRSDNFEDRGTGRRGGGGVPIQALFALVRVLGFKGTLIAGAVAVVGFFLLPAGVKQQLLGALAGGGGGASTQGAGSVCKASPANGAACDFSRAVLASTEDVWTQKFAGGALPSYGSAPGGYQPPTLAVFTNGVGYPRTRWLVGDGAKDELKFKYFIRRHQLPTEVWFNAHPGLTSCDLVRNTKIREGLERRSMSDREAGEWLQLL